MASTKAKAKAAPKSSNGAILQSCADRLGGSAVTEFNGVASAVVPKVVIDDVVATLRELARK
jgi:hypothetical protein|tara:strand:- start:9071 stop:9256 length:186 start_codon:yes stop_codon:yes gene_type:complete